MFAERHEQRRSTKRVFEGRMSMVKVVTRHDSLSPPEDRMMEGSGGIGFDEMGLNRCFVSNGCDLGFQKTS